MSSLMLRVAPRTAPPPPVTEASSKTFREGMRELAHGVCVVTFGDDGDRTGFTATSVASLSSEPPSLIACIDRSSSSYALVERSSAFAVTLLSADQREYAERFAGRNGHKGAERYQRGVWLPLPSGVLCLANAIAAFDCELEERLERHTHAILIGRVRHVFLGTGSGALVYWRGAYDQVGWSREQIERATGRSLA